MGTLTSQTLIDGYKLAVKRHFVFAGSDDETNTILVDASAFNSSDLAIYKIEASLSGFQAQLHWDATANVDILNITEGENIYEFDQPLVNNAGAGKTGDILISTTGTAANDEGTIVLYMYKRDDA